MPVGANSKRPSTVPKAQARKGRRRRWMGKRGTAVNIKKKKIETAQTLVFDCNPDGRWPMLDRLGVFDTCPSVVLCCAGLRTHGVVLQVAELIAGLENLGCSSTTGAGQTLCVLSDSFNNNGNAAALQASGDLPAVDVVKVSQPHPRARTIALRGSVDASSLQRVSPPETSTHPPIAVRRCSRLVLVASREVPQAGVVTGEPTKQKPSEE